MSQRALLVVEDEPAHAELIALGFRGNADWRLHFADSLQDAQSQLEQVEYTLVLADLNLPDGRATTLCSGSVPVVIMTSQGDEAQAISALQGGALDYVVKDAQSLRGMPAVVRRAHRRSVLIEERRQAELGLEAKRAELERNNHRLETVLSSARELTCIDDPSRAKRFIAHVVQRELGAALRIYRQEEAMAPGATLVDPNTLRAPVAGDPEEGFTVLEFRRAIPFDSSEVALVGMAVGLVGETIRGLEARRALRLSQRRLHQADKLRSVGQLAGGIAHDFNNMLTAIMGSAEMLRIDLEDAQACEEQIGQLDLILDVSQHAAKLTRRLLTFARGGSTVRRKISVQKTFQQLSQILEHSLSDTITLEMETPEDLWVSCDGSLLQTSLLNLCLNARDAMPQGGRLRLGARIRELESDFASQYIATGSGGTFVEFWVQDEGHGMDEETQRRIFEPFFTTKEAGVGTGLGLPVVFGAFLDADGGVVVESSPGEGTIFRAYLPLLDVNGDLEPVVRHPEPAASLQVLVVDDNADVLRTTQRLLERMGHKVTSTHEPVKALELAKTQNYDLLLIDVMMPEMGGVEFTRRYFAAGLSSRVVLVSGYSEEQEELKELAIEFGVGFLAKPFTRADLRAAIVV